MRLFEGTQWDKPPTCDRCEKLESDCECPALPEPVEIIPPEKQHLKVRVEKRKRGKIVTVVSGLADDGAAGDLLTKLKNLCGSGGTIKDGSMEIQGDHAARISTELKDIGYKVKG